MVPDTGWVEAAEDSWRHWDALDAGKILYERLVVNPRPAWALAVLDACCAGLSEIPPEVQVVREIANTPARWAEAHKAFQAVRKLVLSVERRTDAGRPEHGILYLAENVAKVAYNASGSRAPFDHDAGWWIAKNARWIVDHSTDA
jgi:hypothetical protein